MPAVPPGTCRAPAPCGFAGLELAQQLVDRLRLGHAGYLASELAHVPLRLAQEDEVLDAHQADDVVRIALAEG